MFTKFDPDHNIWPEQVDKNVPVFIQGGVEIKLSSLTSKQLLYVQWSSGL